MATTKIDIVNRGFALIGEAPISSFTQATPQAERINVLYESLVEAELSSHPWRFAMKQQQLNRLVDTPVGLWDAAYRIPADCIRMHGVFINDIRQEYDRYSDMVYINATEDDVVFAEYMYRADESHWESYFEQVIVYKIASLMGASVGRDANLVATFDSLYQREAAKARTVDSQGQTAKRITSNLFTKVKQI